MVHNQSNRKDISNTESMVPGTVRQPACLPRPKKSSPGPGHPTEQHSGFCDVIRCHFGTAFDARTEWDARHAGQRCFPSTLLRVIDIVYIYISEAVDRVFSACTVMGPYRNWHWGNHEMRILHSIAETFHE